MKNTAKEKLKGKLDISVVHIKEVSHTLKFIWDRGLHSQASTSVKVIFLQS